MKMKSLMLLLMAAAVSVGVILFGFAFVNGQVGEVHLTEETLMGSRTAAEGIKVGCRVDAGDDLHWTVSYDFSSGETFLEFKRGEMETSIARSVYDDFRFTDGAGLPYTTRIENSVLEGLQNGKVQRFYDGLKVGAAGEIRLADYIDYYPLSFRFQFGVKIYNSGDMLTGLKFYESQHDGVNKASEYDEDVQLYVDLNRFFHIPIIETEYQKYQASKDGVKVEAALDQDTDYYQFDPIIVLQEENLMDGETWEHPDLIKGKALGKDGDYAGKTADQYNLKNRLLFVVNNRTAKGASVDVSGIPGGYGIYELPVETRATASVRYGKRSSTVPNPKPLSDRLSMVYPLDEDMEYVEMTMSPDHRYLAVFFVEDGDYYVELIDADLWKKQGVFRMFKATEKLTYAWGEDGSLAVTNFRDEIAVFVKNPDYQSMYQGTVPENFDDVFFDQGLAVTAKNGRIAMVQNPMTGDVREPELTCAVIDKTGILYWGMLNSNIKDSGSIQDAKQRIVPVSSENWVKWK